MPHSSAVSCGSRSATTSLSAHASTYQATPLQDTRRKRLAEAASAACDEGNLCANSRSAAVSSRRVHTRVGWLASSTRRQSPGGNAAVTARALPTLPERENTPAMVFGLEIKRTLVHCCRRAARELAQRFVNLRLWLCAAAVAPALPSTRATPFSKPCSRSVGHTLCSTTVIAVCCQAS